MRFPKIMDTETMNRLQRHEDRLKILEDHKEHCDSQHAEHNRRHSDSIKIQSAIDETLKAILSKIEEFGGYIPSMQRTRNKYIVIDTVKGWFLYVAAIAAGITPILAAYHFLFK